MHIVLRAALMAALFACLMFRPGEGMAQELQRVSAVFCDTQEQMEAVLTGALGDGAPLPAALKTVNDKAGKTACGAVTMLVRGRSRVGALRVGGKTMLIMRCTAVAAFMYGRPIPLPPQDQFYAEEDRSEQGT